MATFFKTIDDLKKYLSVTKSYSDNEFLTRQQYALDQYMNKWLGTGLIADISAAYDAAPDTPMPAAKAALLPLIQLPLAHFTFYEHIPFAQVVVDDSGISRKENANYKTAYANQVALLRKSTLETAYNSLETLLQFLEDNETDYPLWVASTGYTLNKAMFINKASVFNTHYSINMSRLVFKELTPVMVDVEEFQITSITGNAFFDELKGLIAAKTALTAGQQTIIKCIQKAIAYYTIAEAIPIGWTKFDASGLVVIETTGEAAQGNTKTASAPQASLKIKAATTKANNWLAKLKTYLQANIDTYPTYKNDTTVNPEETPVIMSTKKGFYHL